MLGRPPFAFCENHDLAAVGESAFVPTLIEPSTGRTLVVLNAPETERTSQLDLRGDGPIPAGSLR